MSAKKKFNPKLYKEAEKIAGTAVDSFLSQFLIPQFQKIDISEQYKAYDRQYLNRAGGILLIEMEVKYTWDCSGSFMEKYDTVDVPARKKDSIADKYIMINALADTILIADMSKIHEQPIEKKWTKYTRSGEEKFFKCSLDIFDLYFFDGSIWLKK